MNLEEIRVLIVSHNSFSSNLNNGKTLEAIFSSFNKSSLAQLFFSKNENPDFSFCDNYYQICDNDVLQSFLKRKKRCGKKISINDIITKYEKKGDQIVFDFLKKRSTYLSFFRDLLWKTKAWKSKDLFEWIEHFNPTHIFFLGGNLGFSHNIACSLSSHYNLPLITYFTDDYLIYPIKRNIFDHLQNFRMKKFYAKTVRTSSLLFAIGDCMCKEYTSYFNKIFFPIMNSVEIIEYQYHEENKPLIISYFGGLHLSRDEMILKLAKLYPDVEFRVFTSAIPSIKFKKKCNTLSNLKFMGFVSGDQLISQMHNSDILLHVESDDRYYQSLTRLSLSTKIPEYLIAGRMLLGYGPSHLASMRFINENKIGVVIDSNFSDEEIAKYLHNYIYNISIRHEIALSGYNYAKIHFDKKNISRFFLNKIIQVSKCMYY